MNLKIFNISWLYQQWYNNLSLTVTSSFLNNSCPNFWMKISNPIFRKDMQISESDLFECYSDFLINFDSSSDAKWACKIFFRYRGCLIWLRHRDAIQTDKLGCVVRMVVDSLLPYAEFGLNSHRKDAPRFMSETWDLPLSPTYFVSNICHHHRRNPKDNFFGYFKFEIFKATKIRSRDKYILPRRIGQIDWSKLYDHYDITDKIKINHFDFIIMK